MPTSRVLITIARSTEKRERLRAQLAAELGTLDGLDLEFASGDEDILARLPGREVMIGVTVTPEMLAAGRELKWVQLISAGVEHVLEPEILSSPVQITNARGMHVTHMAEHVLAYLLAFARGLPDCQRWQEKHEWHQEELIERVFTLAGRTAGIIGLGAIGQGCAVRLAALGMQVIGIRRRNEAPVPPGVSRALGPEGLTEVLAASDAVIIATPLTRETRGLIGPAQIAAMKPGAYLVNIARARIVDEPAMLAALASGHLAGAGLDVFMEEPLPPGSPLWARPDVILTPHSSGNYPGYVRQATSIFADNLRRWQRGEPLANLVDKTAGY